MPAMHITLTLNDVDKAAQAAYEEFGGFTRWADLGESVKDRWRRIARVVLTHVEQSAREIALAVAQS